MPNPRSIPPSRQSAWIDYAPQGACTLLFAITLLALSGPSWAIVTYRLILDGGVVALWLLAATGLGWRISGHFDTERTLRAVTAAALGLGVISLVTLGLGLCGALNRVSAIGILAIGCAALVFEVIKSRRHRPIHPPEGTHSSRIAWLWLALMPIAAIAVLGAIVPAGILWRDEPHWYDVVEYHLQIPREWYEAGRIVPLKHNVFSYFPFNVEMHYLLAMHLRGGPWAGMYGAQLMHVAMCGLTIVAVFAIVGGGAGGTIAALLAGGVPWLAMLAPVAYVEGGFLLYSTLAIGWAWRAVKQSPAAPPRVFFLAGVFAGFACGTKLTAVPLVLLAVPVALLICRTRLAHILIFLLGGILTLSPWLIRNTIWTGNPVFPEAMSLLGRGHFSLIQMQRWQRAYVPDAQHASAIGRISALASQVLVDWRYGWAFIPLLLVALVLHRRAKATWFLASLLIILMLFWLGFTHVQSRFFVLVIPLGAFAVTSLESRWIRVISACVAIALPIMSAISNGMRLDEQALATDRKLCDAGGTGWLGVDSIGFFHDDLVKQMPPDSRVYLIGDAAAFRWTLPMSRLRYRTVFDVDTTDEAQSIVRDWGGEPIAERSDQQLVIAPKELERFSGTYWKIPALDERWVAHPPANVHIER